MKAVRRFAAGLVLALVAFGVLVAATDDPTVVEESLATFDAPEPIPTAVPVTPTPEPAPTEAATTETEPSAAGVRGATAEVANTEAVEAPAPTAVVDEYYVPNFVGAVDRSTYDADVSTTLAPPTPVPTAPPAPTPTPHVHPTPTLEPAAEPTADAAQENDGGDQENDTEQSADADPTSEPTAEPTSEPDPPSGGPTGAQWEALRQCESGGNYQILSPSGTYRGAYQFSQSTWDWVASGAWPGLVGVDPAQASPADQDKMAFRLYDLRGPGPWPVCGQHLR